MILDAEKGNRSETTKLAKLHRFCAGILVHTVSVTCCNPRRVESCKKLRGNYDDFRKSYDVDVGFRHSAGDVI